MMNIEGIINLLERTINGKIDYNEIIHVMDKVPQGNKFDLAREALHQASHYLADEDLRRKDIRYEESFKEEIRRYILSLQNIPL